MTEKPLSGIGIAITRPADQANKLAKLVREAGGAPIIFPLIEIAPLSDYSQFETVISKISNYDWAIFISSNAVQNGMPRLLKLGLIKQSVPDNLQFAAIGPVTSQALIEFGITKVLTPLSHIQDDDKNKARFDSESLLALPEMVDVNNKKVMIFRGQGGREILAETLKTRGAQVAFAECYQRKNPQTDCNLLAQLYAENKMHGIVITSSEAMRHLLDLAGSSEWLNNVTLFVNHARIAELPTQKGLKVRVAETIGDEAMVKELISNLTPKTKL